MKLILLLAGAVGLVQGEDFDILLLNGRIVDGTGNPAWVGDVGIRAGKIAAMGRRVQNGRDLFPMLIL